MVAFTRRNLWEKSVEFDI